MTRTWRSILLLLTTLALLAACGDDAESDDSEAASETAAPTETVESADEDGASDDDAGAEAASTDDVEPVEGAADRVEILYAEGGTFTSSIEATFADFEAETGIEPEIELGGEVYDDLFVRLQADLTAGDPPDLALVPYNRMRALVDAGAVQPLDGLLDQAGFDLSQQTPSAIDLMRYDDQLYGLPYVISTPIIYYNPDIFEAAGLDPERPPVTWDDVRDYSEAIVSSGAAEHGAFILPNTWIFQSLVESNGGSYATPDGTEAAFNSPEAVGALEFLVGLVDDGLMPNVTIPLGEEAFLRGDIGMFVKSTSVAANISSNAGFEVRTGPFPRATDGTDRLAAGGAGWMLFATEPDRQLAALAALEALTSAEGSATVTSNTGYVPVNEEAADSLLGDLLAAEPFRQPAVDQAGAAVQWHQWSGDRGLEVNAILQDAIAAAVNGTDPQAALDDAAAEANELLG